MGCIYKSVDLVAGETFVLPPGAEVISVSDASVIESSCEQEFTVAEKLCYTIDWALTYDTEGLINYFPLPFNPPIIIPDANNAWDNEGDDPDITIASYAAAGVIVPLGTPATDFTALEASIASSSIGALLTNRKYNSGYVSGINNADNINWNGDFQSGFTVYQLAFKAVPEVAATVYLEFFGASGNIGSIPRYFAKEIDCDGYPTRTEVASSGSPVNTTTTTTTTTTSTTTTTTLP